MKKNGVACLISMFPSRVIGLKQKNRFFLILFWPQEEFQMWKIKLIYTLLIRCKFMCCSQHFTTYLLLLQNILFVDWRRASYIILLIYMLEWHSLVYASPPSDISRLSFWKNFKSVTVIYILKCTWKFSLHSLTKWYGL